MVALRKQINLTVEKGAKLKLRTDQKSPLQGGPRWAGHWWWTSRKQVNLNAEKGTELKLRTDQKSPLAGGPRWAGRWS